MTEILGYNNDEALDVSMLVDEAEDNGNLVQVSDVSADCIVRPDFVSLDFVGERHVPQLHIGGFVDQINVRNTSLDDMPYKISSIKFPPELRPRIATNYAFSTEQLMRLVDKGLYEDGFPVPVDWMQSVQWEIPAHVNVNVVPIEYNGAIVPVTSVDFGDQQFNMEMNAKNSGYYLDQAFPNYREERESYGVSADGQAVEVAPNRAYEHIDFGDVEEQTTQEYIDERNREQVLREAGLLRMNALEDSLGIDSKFRNDIEVMGEVTPDNVDNDYSNLFVDQAVPDVEPVVEQPASVDNTEQKEPDVTMSRIDDESPFNFDNFFSDVTGVTNDDSVGVSDVLGIGITDEPIEMGSELITEADEQEERDRNILRIAHGEEETKPIANENEADKGTIDFSDAMDMEM